jgi:outer membrane protein assembly factor BamE (lipoprotein component of BamABCDE complex)
MVKMSTSKQYASQTARAVEIERAELIVESIDKIKVGDTKEDVERFLGQPDHLTGKEWLYYLDEHSGYVIKFDGVGRVGAVHSWKS